MRYSCSIAVMLTLALHQGWAFAGESVDPPGVKQLDFGRIDSNGDGAISQQELIAAGLDDLAFRAMDIDGDGRLDAEEYARRQALEDENWKMKRR